MNLNEFELSVFARKDFGSKSASKFRSEKKVPAIFYGYGNSGEKVLFSGLIDAQALQKALSSKTLFNKFTKINYEGENYIVVGKVLQRDSLSNDMLHIDFQVVAEGKKITMKVPLKFTDAEACEDIKLGGILNVVMPYIHLVASPEDMPECIECSLKNAKSKTSLTLENIKLPEAVKLSSKVKGKTIATILASRKKNLETAEAAA